MENSRYKEERCLLKSRQTSILHFFSHIPGFDGIKHAVLWNNNQLDYVGTVQRMTKLLREYLYGSPLFGYVLLDNEFGCTVRQKMLNLERYGDAHAKAVCSIIISNYLEQQDRLTTPLKEVKGIVQVMKSPSDPYLDATGMMSIDAFKMKSVLFCTRHQFTLFEVVQIYNCTRNGTEIVVVDGGMEECLSSAQKYATENNYIFIDSEHTFQYAMVGLSTTGDEILKDQPDTDIILLPLRNPPLDCLSITAVSVYMKRVRPSVQTILSKSDKVESLFPDVMNIRWRTNIVPNANLPSLFNLLDEDYDIVDDIQDMNTSQWVTRVIREYTLHYSSMPKSIYNLSSLSNLLNRKYVDQVIEITEDEAAISFMRCLEYTHTQTDGRGALVFAALWHRKIITTPHDKIVGVLTGGYMDFISFQSILGYCLGISGHYFTINTENQIQDDTKSVSLLLQLLGSHSVSVQDVTFDRTGGSSPYHVRVIVQCTSKGFEQQETIASVLREEGYKVQMQARGSSVLPRNVRTSCEQTGNKEISQKYRPYLPRKMTDITPDSIREAAERIGGNTLRTPIYPDKYYSEICGCQLYLKLENIQQTGSFKIRGSSNMVLRVLEGSEPPKGLIAASAGNHAQGVALVAYKLGLPCAIVCPSYAPDGKLNYTRKYGAEVYKIGNSLEECAEYADKLCKERGWLYVKPFNDVDVIEGQGTMGKEILEDIPNVDTVLVNVGGGGMIAGIATYLKTINPKIRIIGVQSEVVAPLMDYKKTELFRVIPVGTTTIADGVNVRIPGGVHSNILRDLVDEYVSVTENEIASTIVNLLSSSRTLSEGAGCLGLAALLHKKVQVKPNERVCVIVCGGNIDMSTLGQIYEYGMRSLGRFFTINITVKDAPGQLSKMIALAAQSELKVQEVKHMRGVGNIQWNEANVIMSLYSHSFAQQNHFLKSLVQMKTHPVVVGREFVKDHDKLYKPFDDLLANVQGK
ncbi:threonine ammonia-lyase [Planoprotostelium fungivorum]|uniref:Threonine ammonia-lyase n=1 Tax=Planoprotostelium fungivorum TaxID=1890364 RepID=A0A2P6N848_9EUKA|nr:threonine ammonia-lyase [Planoprotostelium fungivorum]